jgi:hypothetical protein
VAKVTCNSTSAIRCLSPELLSKLKVWIYRMKPKPTTTLGLNGQIFMVSAGLLECTDAESCRERAVNNCTGMSGRLTQAVMPIGTLCFPPLSTSVDRMADQCSTSEYGNMNC